MASRSATSSPSAPQTLPSTSPASTPAAPSQGCALASGTPLFDNHRIAIMAFLEDTTIGIHDMLYAPCDPQRYLIDYEVTEHRSCKENVLEALATLDVHPPVTPEVFNIFPEQQPRRRWQPFSKRARLPGRRLRSPPGPRRPDRSRFGLPPGPQPLQRVQPQ